MNEARKKERLGVSATDSLCTELGWCFRELPTLDFGIDAMIELIDDEGISAALIALQIKSGDSFFLEDSGDSYVFRFDESHKKYWETYRIPVVIVLYNPNSKALICAPFRSEGVKKCSSGYKLFVKKTASLKSFLESEAKQTEKLTHYAYNHEYMLTQLPFIQRIKDGFDVVLCAEEWVNKSSGRGHISIEVSKGTQKEEYHWNYWFPHQLYQVVLAKLFPWADFEPDESFMEGEEEYSLSKNEIEEINYRRLLSGHSVLPFSDQSERISRIKGILKAGEVVFYKLHLSVNDFGEAFYYVNRELMKMEPYKGLIVSGEIRE